MKKYLSLLALLFSALLLSACTTSTDEEEVKLTNIEKLELLQTMDTPDLNLIYVYADIDMIEADVDMEIDLDGKIKSYTNLASSSAFYNYTELEFNIKSSVINGSGTGSLYALLNKAYLNIDASVEVNGTRNNLKSKEWMEYPQPLPIDEIGNPFEELNLEQFQTLDPETIIEDVEKMLDFVNVYKSGNETSFEVSMTKTKLMSLQTEIKDPEFINIVNSISSGSNVAFTITFKENILRKVELSADFAIDYEGVNLDLNAKIEIDFMPTEPKLPANTELSTYTKVDMFSILDSFMSQPNF